MIDLLKPPRLRHGDVIGIVAPASPALDLDRVQTGVQYLERLGYRVQLGRYLEARHGFCAGTDLQRADDLNRMFRDPKVKAIFALRGGYGSGRLLSLIDYRVVRSRPKIFVGFSDLTALQLALLRRTGLATFSGPQVAVEFGSGVDPYTEEHFWRLLTSSRRPGDLHFSERQGSTILQDGRAEGFLAGGNLALLTSLIGTSYLPNLRGAILAVEDVGEQLHRLDRMWVQLRHAGILRQSAGIVLGRFTQCAPGNPEIPHLPLPEILLDAARNCPGPAIHGFPYGHIRRRVTLPWGVRARLDTRRSTLTLLEAAVA